MHPYENLPTRQFWRTAVATRHMSDIDELWEPKYSIEPQDPIATFGSCFAQHIGRAFVKRGYSWLDGERKPLGLSDQNRRKFNYGIFSCRTGNIYTTSLLTQWLRWTNDEVPPAECWENDGRFFDPFRPNIEPGGFESPEEMGRSRQPCIDALNLVVSESSVFVFTLGLTESWFNRAEGYEYPLCPGTVSGLFDPNLHVFENQRFQKVCNQLEDAIKLLRSKNPTIRILLTVSPVPLTATNSGRHVLAATMESKSILRAAAGQLAETYDYIDYFPSYELVSSPVFKGASYDPNQRTINRSGVDFVMKNFFQCLTSAGTQFEVEVGNNASGPTWRVEEDVVCEEELIDAFAVA